MTTGPARLAEIPVSRCRDLGQPGWPGCRVIAKLIFVAFNRRAEISAKWASSANLASPAHVIGPLKNLNLFSATYLSPLSLTSIIIFSFIQHLF